MAELEFEDIRFEEDKADKDSIRMVFLRLFESVIPKVELEQIGTYRIDKAKDNAIEFPGISEKQANNKFNIILSKAFDNLKNRISGSKTIYIHRNSGIPLFGSLSFGIVDRGTDIIELRPITGCTLNCIFCSVSEGAASRKQVDFVVEEEYLVQELAALLKFKQAGKSSIDLFINTQGEPLLYTPIVDLVRDIRALPQVRHISIITNATLLSKNLADQLIDAGLDQLNISLNAMDKKKAQEFAGTENYNLEHVKDMLTYVSKKIRVIIAPVWIRTLNDEEIPKIIGFAKKIGAEIGIQNYLVHGKGRKITEQVSWDEFSDQLEEWEKATSSDLMFKAHSGAKTKTLDKPFRKGDTVKAQISCPGRLNKEVIAVAKGRAISVVDCTKEKGSIKLKILKDKDNTYVAKEI